MLCLYVRADSVPELQQLNLGTTWFASNKSKVGTRISIEVLAYLRKNALANSLTPPPSRFPSASTVRRMGQENTWRS